MAAILPQPQGANHTALCKLHYRLASNREHMFSMIMVAWQADYLVQKID